VFTLSTVRKCGFAIVRRWRDRGSDLRVIASARKPFRLIRLGERRSSDRRTNRVLARGTFVA
jgi:hypothetical protein